MNRISRILILSAVVVSIIIVSAVSWHSVQEIHYLKSFYPQYFGVQEAFWASAVELIKVLVISLPFFLIIIAWFCMLHYWKRTS
jgi:hypothetical protein